MSATINIEIFKNYFSSFKFKHLDIGGKTNYPIESIFLPENSDKNMDYKNKGLEIIKKIIRSDDMSLPGAHDILFFVTSVSETTNICSQISNNMELSDNGYCLEVYSGIDKEKEKIVKSGDDSSRRKIIIATNVAESSLTIDGIKYVIDAGLELFSYFDPKTRANVLAKQFISNAQAKQRMGRSGRTEPGICYHLYTENSFLNEMKKYPEPNIRTSNLRDEFIKLLSIETVGTIDNLLKILDEFIEPPKKEYITSGLDQLTELGLINKTGLTDLGKMLADTQFDPMDFLSVYSGHYFHCAKPVINIISMITACKGSISEIFSEDKIKKNQKKFNEVKNDLNNKYGDHIALLTLYKTYLEKKENHDGLKKWSHKYFLNLSIFHKAHEHNKKYMSIYRRFSQDVIKNKNKDENNIEKDITHKILASFLFGYRINLAKSNDNYTSTSRVKNIEFSKYCLLKKRDEKNKKLLLFYELFTGSSNTSINIVSNIGKKAIKYYEELNNIIT